MRFSCLTSKFVWVVLDTSMCFSGVGNDSSLGDQSLTLGSTWWRNMKFPDMDQKSFIASPASGSDPSDSPRKSTWPSLWIGRCRTKVDALSSWSPPEVLIRPSVIGKILFSFFGTHHLFHIDSFWVDFRCVHRLQLLKVCNQCVTLPSSPRVQSVSEEQSRQDFLSKIDGFLTDPSQF